MGDTTQIFYIQNIVLKSAHADDSNMKQVCPLSSKKRRLIYNLYIVEIYFTLTECKESESVGCYRNILAE